MDSFDDDYDHDSKEEDLETFDLSISTELANSNYEKAGELVREEPDQVSLTSHAHLLNDKMHNLIEEVLMEVNLPYRPSDFQMISLHVLGSHRNLLLISPTGSGKTLVIFLGTLLLRKMTGISQGVCLVTEPLNLILTEKLGNSLIPTGVISMTGQLRSSLEERDGVCLSKPEEEFLDGSLPCLFGHPESWLSEKGPALIIELHNKGRKLYIFNITNKYNSFC